MRLAITLSTFFLAAQLHAKPLKVFILAGQSNMEGHAKIETFDYIGAGPGLPPNNTAGESFHELQSPRARDRDRFRRRVRAVVWR